MQKGPGNINPQVGGVSGQPDSEMNVQEGANLGVEDLKEVPDLPDQMLLDLVAGPKINAAENAARLTETGAKLSPEAQKLNQAQLLRGLQIASWQETKGNTDLSPAVFLRQASDKLRMVLLHASNETSKQLGENIEQTGERLGAMSEQLKSFLANRSEGLSKDVKLAALQAQKDLETAIQHGHNLGAALKDQDEVPDQDTLDKAARLRDSLDALSQSVRDMSVSKPMLKQLGDLQQTLARDIKRLSEMQDNVDRKIAGSAPDAPMAIMNFIKAGNEVLPELAKQTNAMLRNPLNKSIESQFGELKDQFKEWQTVFTELDTALRQKEGMLEVLNLLKEKNPEFAKFAKQSQSALAQILLSTQIFPST